MGIDKERMTRLSLLLGLAGLLVGIALVGWFGFGNVLRATASVGVVGFAAVCGWQMVLFAVLGLCWFVLLPASRSWRVGALVWGRMVRDAAGGCLPFSVVGGFVLGARSLTLLGISSPVATASTVVDLTTEFLAQIGLVLIGIGILVGRSPASSVVVPACLGLVAAALAGAAFIWVQRAGGLPLARLSRRILGGRMAGADAPVAAVQQWLGVIYASPWRVALGFALHLAAWFGTGVASWIAFRLLGADISFWTALGIEALLHAVLATAILVPGYAGVQEGAYAAVGALFGQPPELALGVSLLRRARDIALGVPILLAWQAVEWRKRQTAMA